MMGKSDSLVILFYFMCIPAIVLASTMADIIHHGLSVLYQTINGIIMSANRKITAGIPVNESTPSLYFMRVSIACRH